MEAKVAPVNPSLPPVDVAILAFPETTASVTYGMYDLFMSVGRDWGFVVDGQPGPALVQPSIVASRAQPTGMAPLQYVHTLRLEEAKHMLETSDQPIEAIANEVPYEDAGFFSRLFRRQVRLTSAQYRKRFGSMRRALRNGG